MVDSLITCLFKDKCKRTKQKMSTKKILLPPLLVTHLTILANLLFSQDDNQVHNPVAEKLA